MKKINFTLSLGILLLILIAASCKKDDEMSSIGFSLKAVDTPTSDPSSGPIFHGSTDANTLPLSWNVAWLYVTKLDLSAQYAVSSSLNDGNNLQYYTYTWQGNQRVDLFGKPVDFANFELPKGVYSSFDVTLTSARMGSSGTPNFYLSGIYGSATLGTSISVTVTQPFEMKIKYDVTVNTGQKTYFGALIELALNQVFNGISASELDNAEITDGWILISATHNIELYNKILENLQAKPDNSVIWSVHKVQ